MLKLLLAALLLVLLSEATSAAVYCRAGVYVRGCVARPGVVVPRERAVVVRPIRRSVYRRR